MRENKIATLPDSTDDIELEAALCALLSEFFVHNPDDTLFRALAELSPEDFDAFPAVERSLRVIIQNAHKAIENEAALLDFKRDWTKLFRGISPDYGPTAPYAFLFLKCNTTAMLSELAALYIDGGYDDYQNIRDRIDYIGTCFAYLKTVDLQRIHAVQEKNLREFMRLNLCREIFLRQFLLPWIHEFASRARKFVQTPFYSAVLNLTDDSVRLFAGDLTSECEILSEEESRRIALEEDKKTKKMIDDIEKEAAKTLQVRAQGNA